MSPLILPPPGYLREDADVLSALQSARRHVRPGGLFIFDVWNGTAVLAQKPEQRTLTIDQGAVRITRKTSARLDADKQLIHVHFDIARTQESGATQHWEEDHVVRFFFPQELGALLSRSGFRLLDLRRFPDAEAPPDENAWNIIGVARAE